MLIKDTIISYLKYLRVSFIWMVRFQYNDKRRMLAFVSIFWNYVKHELVIIRGCGPDEKEVVKYIGRLIMEYEI